MIGIDMRRFTILTLVWYGVSQTFCHPTDSTFHNLVCQQCNSWCTAGQSGRVVEEPARIGKSGPRGPIGPRGLPGIVNMTAIEEMVDRKIERAVGFLSIRSCRNIQLESALSTNITGGVFDIFIPSKFGQTTVYCDATTDGGGWIVFQRRMDGRVDFHRNWNDYVNGFGEVDEEFWLGLEAIYQLTKSGDQERRVDMIEKGGTRYYAKYSSFQLGPSSDNYRLSVSGYSGNATDSLNYHNGQQFTTSDSDNDAHGQNCGAIRKAAWWYKRCDTSNLNGQFDVMDDWAAIYWYDQLKRKRIHMKFTEMKIRRKLM